MQAVAFNFLQEDLEVKDQNFGERYLALAKDFGKLFMTIIYRHTFALKSTYIRFCGRYLLTYNVSEP